MKRVVLLAVLSLVSISAMGQWRYYTLEECGNDPLKYIEMNYEDNAFFYSYSFKNAIHNKGLTIADFVRECELELKDFVPNTYYKGEVWGHHTWVNKVVGIWFDIYHSDYTGDYLYSVPIYFLPPFPYTIDDFHNLEDNERREEWKDLYYQFFKDYTIDYIGPVLKVRDGEYIENYYRPNGVFTSVPYEN